MGISMITVALLDDDSSFIKRSQKTISTSLHNSQICDNEYRILPFTRSDELIELSRSKSIDILVLDIHMPEPNGLSVAEHFHAESPDTKIIFLSSYEQYVFYSLRFAPFRFVRKSKLDAELPEAIIGAVTLLCGQNSVLDISTPGSKRTIPLSKIICIEKVKGKNYLDIKCTNEVITVRQNIASVEKGLNKSQFTKINPGTIVNMKYIHQIKGDKLYLHSGELLKISRRSVDQVKDDYFGYVRNNSVN